MKRNIDLKEISDGRLYSSGDMVKADCRDCEGCSDCCRGMGSSIVLDPLDAWRLGTWLHLSFDQMLERQIEQAREVAGNAPLIVYLDPTDEDKLQRIALHQGSGVELRLSQYSFGGGTRAVIPSQNILIDNSFTSRIEEAKRHISFHLTEKGGQGHD